MCTVPFFSELFRSEGSGGQRTLKLQILRLDELQHENVGRAVSFHGLTKAVKQTNAQCVPGICTPSAISLSF